jgi:FAD/FMN-containing dehydrogenase
MDAEQRIRGHARLDLVRARAGLLGDRGGERIRVAREDLALAREQGGTLGDHAGDRPQLLGERSFERLQALKDRYDPDNVLRRNQNIPPRPVTAARD